MHYAMIHDITLQHMQKKLKQSPVLVCVLTDYEMNTLVPNGDFTQLEPLSEVRFDIKFSAKPTVGSNMVTQGDMG
jgi:hypothetical protein